jgi:RNA polymerase-binding transcription factor DksA
MAAKKSATTKKKATAKKKAAPAKKKTTQKAAPAKKKAAVKKKAVAKKAAAKKAVAKKPAARKGNSAGKSAEPKKASAKGGNHTGRQNKHLSAKDIKNFHKLLLDLRDRVTDEITFLTGDNLNRSQRDASGDLSNYGLHMADQGTDNFDREFALNLVSSEQDIIYEIDEAIRRIDSGTYGICESSGDPIEKERLKVIPHARYCVSVQSEMEKGKSRQRRLSSVVPLN